MLLTHFGYLTHILSALEPGNHGSALPETTYLAVILGEYYPVVMVSEDRKSVQISNWNDQESFPDELLELQTAWRSNISR